jgi:uncharacterized protein YkwD
MRQIKFLTAILLSIGCISSSAIAFPNPRNQQMAGNMTNSTLIAQANLSPLEQGVIDEINRVRTNPTDYVAVLEEWRAKFEGDRVKIGNNFYLQTQEGVRAVDEAIQVLRSTRPLPPLSTSQGMSLAAKDHVNDQGPKGNIGHNGSDGSDPGTRIKRYGSFGSSYYYGENISYGLDKAQAVVMQLIIDDGVPSRGHRENILKPEFQSAGVGCGAHAQYQTMCVIDFAQGYIERGSTSQSSPNYNRRNRRHRHPLPTR